MRNTKKTTVYFDPSIYRELILKADAKNMSNSALVNIAVTEYLLEDQEDLRACDDRINESTISYRTLINHLGQQEQK